MTGFFSVREIDGNMNQALIPPTAKFPSIFSRDYPVGHCRAVAIPSSVSVIQKNVLDRLHPEEKKYAQALPMRRRPTWVGGRIALREALKGIGAKCEAILPDERGAPVLPHGISGSISHKSDIAVALVSAEKDRMVGVDVEHLKADMDRIVRRVMSPDELTHLMRLPKNERSAWALICFSCKEAYYKALPAKEQSSLLLSNISVFPKKNGRANICISGIEKNEEMKVEAFWELYGQKILSAVGIYWG